MIGSLYHKYLRSHIIDNGLKGGHEPPSPFVKHNYLEQVVTELWLHFDPSVQIV